MSATMTVSAAHPRRTAADPSVRVVMVGPGLQVRGGISMGQRLLIEALPNDVSINHIASMVEGSKWRKLRTFIRALLAVREHVRGGEVVHILFASGASSRRKMIIARLAMRRGASVIMHARGGGYREYWQSMSGAERRFTLNTLRRAHRPIVLGDGWRDFFVSVGVPGQRVITAPNPVVLPKQVPQRVAGDTVRFLYLGMIIRRKGTFDLLEAIARLPAELRSRVHVVMAGNGALAELRGSAAALGISGHVDIRDWVSPQERDQLLAAADAFVLPSYVEGMPNALLEAMAWSLPCICTPVGSVPEFVKHRVNGLIVRPGAIDELSAAIAELAGDASLRVQLGREARRSMEPLDIQVYARTMCELYRSAMPRQASGAP